MGGYKLDYSGLNHAQERAVFSDAPRLLCLAGAGTGKTRVLTHRIARLYEEGVPVNQMLAITFTKAAGAEMKERIIGLIGEDGKELFCNTYHAWAARLIRQNSYKFGLSPAFTIYDNEDTIAIITSIIDDLSYSVDVKKVLEAMNKETVYRVPLPKGEIEQIVREYRMRCRRYNALDFNGLIAGLQTLLKDEMFQEELRYRYPYIFVDEFQDTDHRQMEILEAINPKNLFVVGDDFQSIYGFRGADVSIIMRMAENPQYETIKLEENYRSTQPIVEAANRLIKHNKQTEKVLKSNRGGEYPLENKCLDESDQAWFVCAEIESLHKDFCSEVMYDGDEEPSGWIKINGLQYKDIAILGRTNKAVEEIAQALKEEDIPYTIKTRAHDPLMSKDAKKLMLWMSAILNQKDDVAVEGIMNWPETTATNLQKMKAEMFQMQNDCSLLTALQATETAPYFLEKYHRIKRTIEEEYDADEQVSAVDLMHYVVRETGIANYYSTRGLHNRVNNIQQIYEFITAWQEKRVTMGEEATAAAWLDYFSLMCLETRSEEVEEKEDAVHIMTAHGSKGLEFDTVFIIGCNQKSFPLGRGDIEEERRLFYVAMTRAKERLYLTWPAKRRTWGTTMEPTEPSIFLKEIE